jgi:hypothetical protein
MLFLNVTNEKPDIICVTWDRCYRPVVLFVLVYGFVLDEKINDQKH